MSEVIVPLVSVCVVTYNQEKYIRQCLDSILMQVVNFSYEILIHDDASSDNTIAIIHEYELKYPDIIKPIYRKNNVFSKGYDVAIYNFERARGYYMAHCDGDDFWIDKNKLQKQVDFLEEHLEYIGTAHNVVVVNTDGETISEIPKTHLISPPHIYTLKDCQRARFPGAVGSWVHRNIFLSMNSKTISLYYELKCQYGDRKLSLLLALNGDIYCMGDIMSAYRQVLFGGMNWTSLNQNKNLAADYYLCQLKLAKFSYSAYNVELMNYRIALMGFGSGFKRLMLEPNWNNVLVIKKIMSDTLHYPKYIIFFLRYLVMLPLRFMIYREI